MATISIKNSCDAHAAQKIKFGIFINHYQHEDDRTHTVQTILTKSEDTMRRSTENTTIAISINVCDMDAIFIVLKFDAREYDFCFQKYQITPTEEDISLVFEIFSGKKLPYARMNGQKCDLIEECGCRWQKKFDKIMARSEKKLTTLSVQSPQEHERGFCFFCPAVWNYIVGFFDCAHDCASPNMEYAPIETE